MDTLNGEFLKKGVQLALALSILSSMWGGGCAPRVKSVDEAQMHYQLALNLIGKGESTQGLSELIKAGDLDPTNAEVQNLLGLSFFQRDMYDKSEIHLRSAVKLDPNFSDAFNNLCSLQIKRAKFDDAIKSCTKAIENVTYATPERAYFNMGVAYEKKGDLPKSMEAHRKALLHNENFVLSRKAVGLILSGQKKYVEASKELQMAGTTCVASPKGAWGNECSEVFYNLGLVYVKLKGHAKAVAAFRSCVNTDNQGTYGQKCRENLKILE